MPKKRKKLDKHIERRDPLEGQHEREEADAENYALIVIDEVEQWIPLYVKEFSTGSKGFHGVGKLWLDPATRYQCNILCVLIGSKPR